VRCLVLSPHRGYGYLVPGLQNKSHHHQDRIDLNQYLAGRKYLRDGHVSCVVEIICDGCSRGGVRVSSFRSCEKPSQGGTERSLRVCFGGALQVRREISETIVYFFLNQLSVSKLCKRPDCVTLKPVLSDQLYNNSPHVKIEVMSNVVSV
jgi:hypothetical protein